MASTFTPNVLAEGQIPNAQAAIYTVPAATSAYLKSLVVKNTNAVVQTVRILINVSGTPRAWKQAQLAIDEYAEFLDAGETLELPTGASVEAVTTTPAVVDFVLSGVTQT